MQEPRDELHRLVDGLPDAELSAARRFLQFLSEDSIRPEFAALIRRGIAQADARETIICNDYDDMVAKLLGAWH
jgi:hypothetical protein